MNIAKPIIKFVEKLFQAKQKTIHTNIVCQVVSYDAASNTCSVQPCVRAMRAADVNNMIPFDLPQIDDVPVKQMGSGKLLLSVAPAVDSYGILEVSECSIEAWINEGGIVNPTSTRNHHFSDGVFDPGVYPNKIDGDNGRIESAIKTDRISLRTRSGTTEISVLDDDSIHVESTGKMVVVCDELTVNGDTNAAAMSNELDVYISKLDAVLRSWVVVPTDGGAALKAAYIAAQPAAPGSMASDNIKTGG